MIKRYVIIKGCNEGAKNEFWENEGYHEYKKIHGMHFSDKLAAWASSKMQNSDGTQHSWSIDDVKGAFKTLGFELPKNYTWGDATYLANFLYSDLSSCLKTDTEAVKMAHSIMSKDADGYEGMIFNRYTADIMEKGVCISWNEMM